MSEPALSIKSLKKTYRNQVEALKGIDGIINCDANSNEETNTAILLEKLIPDSHILNICNGDNIVDVRKFQGFIITGSKTSLNADLEWIRYLRSTIKQIHNYKIPCLGICFGMQIVADVFGGTVLRNTSSELGFKNVNVDNNYELFRDMPGNFKIYQSHNDTVGRVPEGAEIIARNENRIQGFILDNFYCVQFHPEINSGVAVKMAEKNRCNVDEILNDVGRDYYLPQKVILNFINSYK